MSSTKLVKRYANRKLYDTEQSCYVTLEDISMMIQAGEEVKVIDNKTGEDLTSVTLAQIIFETEKKKNFMPLSLLRGLIQESGQSIGDFARGQVETVQTRATEIRDTAQARATDISDSVTKLTSSIGDTVTRVIKKGEDGEEVIEVEGETAVSASAPQSVKEMLSSSQKAIEDIQKSVEARIQEGIGTVSGNVSREVEDILHRLGSLKSKFRK
ncbi:MAG: polyhydroxyalkanoate synthesis regulator DNA-binding domain-containing protein [Myxococcota bacterium]|nr:polyhydroxyalkanoate synthesis regulator DNA-binding domain-containing protein [Myxococcota bacterium]